jgi:hypothetical protein
VSTEPGQVHRLLAEPHGAAFIVLDECCWARGVRPPDELV